MSEPVTSSSWYRVATLRPRFRRQGMIHRHHYRGVLWYVLENPSDLRIHRFTPETYSIIQLFDGTRTVEALWREAMERFGDRAPTQGELIQILAELFQAEVLTTDVAPSSPQVQRAREKKNDARVKQSLLSPLMWRLPIFDPNAWLQQLDRRTRPLFTRAAFFVWLAVLGVGGVTACYHAQDLLANLSDRILAPHNLLLLWLLFPLLKAAHELGHACAVRAFGGSVKEMGVLLLVLTPVPYVDASAASAFPSKRDRMVVGAAGMMAELFIASIAAVLWALVEPGLVRSLLYDVMFLAGASTLLFNLNPLLRFDGYYMLTDAIEIPNLARRGKSYLVYLFERYVIGHQASTPPASTREERRWIIGYALASTGYRLMILLAIIVFVATRFPAIGSVIALWAFIAWGVLPVLAGVRHLQASPHLAPVRRRAFFITGGLTLGVLAFVCIVPAPLRSQAEGLVWTPSDAVIRANAEGFAAHWHVAPGSPVAVGDAILTLRSPERLAEINNLRAELDELRARRSAMRLADRVEAQLLLEEQSRVQQRLAATQEEVAQLTVRSPATGTLALARPDDLLGQLVRKGDAVAHVIDAKRDTVRVIVPQSSIDLVRRADTEVDVRLMQDLETVVPAVIEREVPGGSWQLPSAALGTAGGGTIPVDPGDREGLRVVEKIFQFDVRLPQDAVTPWVGGRAVVRFRHPWEPLAARWYRGVKRLFLETSSG